MKCAACNKEISGDGKLISCDGDFVCDDACHTKFISDMNRMCNMTDAEFEIWMDSDA